MNTGPFKVSGGEEEITPSKKASRTRYVLREGGTIEGARGGGHGFFRSNQQKNHVSEKEKGHRPDRLGILRLHLPGDKEVGEKSRKKTLGIGVGSLCIATVEKEFDVAQGTLRRPLYNPRRGGEEGKS